MLHFLRVLCALMILEQTRNQKHLSRRLELNSFSSLEYTLLTSLFVLSATDLRTKTMNHSRSSFCTKAFRRGLNTFLYSSRSCHKKHAHGQLLLQLLNHFPFNKMEALSNQIPTSHKNPEKKTVPVTELTSHVMSTTVAYGDRYHKGRGN